MKTARMNSTDFNRIMAAVKDFTGIVKPIFEYIKLELNADTKTITAVACDGFKLSAEHAVVEQCDESFECFVRYNIKFPNDRTLRIVLDEDLRHATLMCMDFRVTYKQPESKYLDWRQVVPTTPPDYRIAFNGDLLLDALKAAKISCGRSFKDLLIIEFRAPNEPIVIRTNEDDIKLVLPIRMQKGEK